MSQAPLLMKDNDPMFISYWVCENVGSSRGKEIYRAFFKPSDMKEEDLVTLTGLGFMKTMVAFFDKKRVEAVMKPRYQFVDDDTGKKTYVKFKWEGEDLVIGNSNLYMQEITNHTGTSHFPSFYLSTELALEMGWFQKRENKYVLGSNLVMELIRDSIPVPTDTGKTGDFYWSVSDDDKRLKISLTCNWRFINLNHSFKNMTGSKKRSLFVVRLGSGVVGNQVTDLLREVNYKREGKGSQYFEPLHIQYIPVRKEVLDIIEVQVAETTGPLVKFGEGNTIVTLHFTRS